MAKTYKHLFSGIIDFQNLLLAARKAQKGKRYRDATLAYNFNLEDELFSLRDELQAKTYRPGPYREFIVKDSKKRYISAAPYKDRVVHHALLNVIEPLFDRRFIFDTYACRKGKGTHAALYRFRKFLAGHKYVLKCDIRKYFPNVDHEILLEKLRRRIADPDTMELLEKIVGSRTDNHQSPAAYFPGDDLFTPHIRKRGIPIGNLTSQFFANLYLDDFDHWIKEELRAGPYLRYADDFCVFGDDKGRLNEIRSAIRGYLETNRLQIHQGKSRIYTKKEGVEFLGFRHLPDRTRIRKDSVRRFQMRMKRLQRDYATGKASSEQVRASVGSWIAHATYADSYRLRTDLIPRFVFIKGGKTENSSCAARR